MSRRTTADAGARIRSLRLRFDRSEESFAALVGVEPATVRMWEAGEGIDRDALLRIAAATDTALEWLIAGLAPAEVEAIRRAARAWRAKRGAEGPASQRVGGTEGRDPLRASGGPIRDLVDERGLEIAKSRLADPKFDGSSVAALALGCGFSDPVRFRRLFAERFGVGPDDFRRRR